MSDGKSSVNFSCQRCLQPLRLDESLHFLGEHDLAELSLHVSCTGQDRLAQDMAGGGGAHRRHYHHVPPFRLTAPPPHGFTLISEEEQGQSQSQSQTLSRQLLLKAALFDTLSENSDVDHPLCDECTDLLLSLMNQQLRLAEAELVDYSEYLNKLDHDTDDLDIESLQKELDNWKREEKRLLDELDALRTEEAETEKEIDFQEKEKDRLAEEQNIYWRAYTRYRKELLDSEDRAKFYECQLSYTQSQLEKLKKTNVFKAAFYISDSGHFGIINNFRLGRLPGAPVDWSEINAAWGQTALLLSSLARKIDLKFARYNLVPYGNHSYLESIEDKKELPLYSSGGFKLIWDTKFDSAMVAFLDCVQQFQDTVEKSGSEFCFPYKIDRGKIEDTAKGNTYSVKLQFNSEEQWTKALKYMLTNLKWGLAWVSSQLTEDKAE